MAELRAAVYVAPPVPARRPPPVSGTGNWSPVTCTLIYSTKEAVLVDTPITIKQTEGLITWIEKIASGRRLSYIYITHGHADHFLGLNQLLQRFPEAVPVATRGTLEHMKQQVAEPYFPKPGNIVSRDSSTGL